MIVDNSAFLDHKNSSRDLDWKLDVVVVGGFQFQGKRKGKRISGSPYFTFRYLLLHTVRTELPILRPSRPPTPSRSLLFALVSSSTSHSFW